MRSISCSFVLILLAVCCSPVFSQNFQHFEFSNLPIVIINTHGASIQDEPKINVDFGIIDAGPGVINHITDPLIFDGRIAIEIRGSSSQMFPKKQYGFEIIDEAGVEYDTSLLGMPAESDWILFAPYNDKSLMRDVLAYKLAGDLGWYAPRIKYCELMLNDAYQGVYVLIEKIKRDKMRVDIDKLDPDENSGDDLTGGYIIKIDKQTGDSDHGWNSEYPPLNRRGGQVINFLFEYPDADDITGPQRDYIKEHISNFETTLKSSEFADPIDGYAKFIDVESFIDFFIINEISKNVDGYRLSTYLHKQNISDGGKLVMGPVWDFNLGFGNADYCTKGTTGGIVLDFNRICPDDWWLIPFWWERFFQDVNFSTQTRERWNKLREDKLSTARILEYIDSVATALDEPQERNFVAWPVLNTYVWPNYYVGATYQDEVSWLKTWVTNRMSWLDTYMEGLVTGAEQTTSGIVAEKPFPNPAQESYTFSFSIQSPGNLLIEVYDMLGRKVDRIENKNIQGTQIEIKTGENWPSATYYYRVKFNNHLIGKGKLIKK